MRGRSHLTASVAAKAAGALTQASTALLRVMPSTAWRTVKEAAVCLRFFCYEEVLNLLSQHYLSSYPERSTDSTALQG